MGGSPSSSDAKDAKAATSDVIGSVSLKSPLIWVTMESGAFLVTSPPWVATSRTASVTIMGEPLVTSLGPLVTSLGGSTAGEWTGAKLK